MHQLCILYQLIQSSTRCQRERVAVNMQGIVFTFARLKIVPTIKNLHHIQCQCVDESSSLVEIKLEHSFLTAINQAGRI